MEFQETKTTNLIVSTSFCPNVSETQLHLLLHLTGVHRPQVQPIEAKSDTYTAQ